MENVLKRGPFPCMPSKGFFFTPLKSCQIFLFHLVHLMNMYNHRSKHVFNHCEKVLKLVGEANTFLLNPLKKNRKLREGF
jgi:hypothetical protein